MPRKIPEWTGKTDDTAIPDRVKLRILDRQDFKCALTGVAFGPKLKPEFDHITPLRMGGENRESNLQALIKVAHKTKTSDDRKNIAKSDRIRKARMGIKSGAKSAFPGSKGHKFKRKLDGTVVLRGVE